MTIKHMNKNISAEKAQVVTNITSSPNGLLVTKTNLHDEASVSDAIDLTGTKLHLMILNSDNDLDLLADCDTDNKLESLNNYFEGEYQISFDSLEQLNDYIQSKMFLVEDSTSREEDNIYNEYIWMNGDFELIGTTRIDLTNYIQKSNGTNLLLTDGTNIAQSTFAQATALTGKEDTSNKSSSITTDTGSTSKYPTVKAVEDYAEPKNPVGTLTDFKSLIENATVGQIIILDRDYKGTENCSISLNETVTIIGNGHTINANNYRLVINLGTNSTLTFIDCIFTNINVDGTSYSFIRAVAANRSSLTLHNCIIKNSTVKGQLITGQDNGNYGVVFNIINCVFYNNTVNSSAGGLLVFINNNFNVLNTVFENNTVTSIHVTNTRSNITNQQVVDCVFNNNTEAIRDASNTNYKVLSLKNNKFVQSGDTLYGCTNGEYLSSAGIKTINNESIVGTGNLNIEPLSGTLSDLQTLINNASSGDTIVLDKDYAYNSSTDSSLLVNYGVRVIGKTITIVGNGHIIDSKNAIASISNDGTGTASITLIDLKFKNSKGGFYVDSNGNLTMENCFCYNSSSTYDGAWVSAKDAISLNIENCTFINGNTTGNGGAIYCKSNHNISNCTFINNQCTGNGNDIASYDSGLVVKNCITSSANLYNAINKNYLSDHQDISGKEDTSNKVTTMSSSSTDTQYPSAKAVYDALPKTTKTLTVTYTNGTTEDIEFYIK